MLPFIFGLNTNCPSAIFRTVIFIWINPIQRMVFTWFSPHILYEVFKALPSFAVRNPSPAVIRIHFIFRIIATAFNVAPANIFGCSVSAVCPIITFIWDYISMPFLILVMFFAIASYTRFVVTAFHFTYCHNYFPPSEEDNIITQLSQIKIAQCTRELYCAVFEEIFLLYPTKGICKSMTPALKPEIEAIAIVRYFITIV